MKRVTGFSLVELLIVMAILAMLVGLLMPAIQAVRETARQSDCRNNLRQIGLGLVAYETLHGVYPPGYVTTVTPSSDPTPPPPAVPTPPSAQAAKQPQPSPWRRWDAAPPTLKIEPSQPGWGWMMYLTPHLEEELLWSRTDRSTPVESPNNSSVRTAQISVVRCPTDDGSEVFTVLNEVHDPLGEAASNSYVACFGSYGLINTDPDHGNGLFQRNSRIRALDVRDGLSKTMAIGERAAMFAKSPWAGVMTGGTCRTTPGAPVYGSVTEKAPSMVLARIGNRTLNSPYSEPYDFFSPHIGKVFFAFADGSLRDLSTETDIQVLHALATRDSGELLHDATD